MVDQNSDSISLEQAVNLAKTIRESVSRSIFGQERLITEAMTCLLSGGHILMTGAPGLAKTTLVRVFARNLGLSFGRIQFTPDLLPSDIVGSEVLNIDQESGRRSFDFMRGPVFVNLLLADEINRASPRTQSALLESMQERSVTVGGHVHRLPMPFMVFATQNPFESEGTFPLPEAQLDRFLLHTLVDYPDEESETRLLKAHVESQLVGEQFGQESEDVGDKMSAETLAQVMKRTRAIHVDDEIVQGINSLVRSTRPTDESCPKEHRESIWYGAGPRAGISLISVCKARALLEASEVVRWRHVKELAKPVLRHRIKLTAIAKREGLNEDALIEDLSNRIEDRYKRLATGLD